MFTIKMGFFSKKNEEPTYGERISSMEKRLTRFEAELLDLATAQDIIRNKVLRKIQYKKAPEEEEEEENSFKGIPKTKNINSNPFKVI